MKEKRHQNRKRYSITGMLLLFFLLGLPCIAPAFNMVGPRSMGMGGAFVAVTNDSTAVYWNPAAITQIERVEISPFAGAEATDTIYDTIKDLDDWNGDHEGPVYTPAEIEDLQDILKRLNKDDAGTFIDANAGLSLATKWFALSSVALGQGNLDPYGDLEPSHLGPNQSDRAKNTSRVDINSLVTNNIALTFASTLGIPNIAFGTNLKYIQGYQYTDSYYLFNQSTGEYNEHIDYRKRFNDKRVDGWAWGIDAGLLFLLGDYVKVGILGRNINEPEIDWDGGHPKTKLHSQYRAGLALMPFKGFTLSVDGDITEQGQEIIETKSGVKYDFDESREISAGLEWWLLDQHLALRGGVNNITESGEMDRFYTGGIGIRIPYLGFDLAGGYGGENRYAFSVGLNIKF